MSITVIASGTQTAVLTTEHTLDTDTTGKNYVLVVDTVNLVNDETLTLRIYTIVLTSGAERLVYEANFKHIQSEPIKYSLSVPANISYKATLEQNGGTGRAFPWSILTDTVQSDIDDIKSRIPTALINGRMNSDLEAIGNSTIALANFKASTLQIITGAAEGTPTTTVIQTNLAEGQNDIYIGRTVIFSSGAAKDEATDITDYVGATGTLTVTELSNAPAAADTFLII